MVKITLSEAVEICGKIIDYLIENPETEEQKLYISGQEEWHSHMSKFDYMSAFMYIGVLAESKERARKMFPILEMIINNDPHTYMQDLREHLMYNDDMNISDIESVVKYFQLNSSFIYTNKIEQIITTSYRGVPDDISMKRHYEDIEKYDIMRLKRTFEHWKAHEWKIWWAKK